MNLYQQNNTVQNFDDNDIYYCQVTNDQAQIIIQTQSNISVKYTKMKLNFYHALSVSAKQNKITYGLSICQNGFIYHKWFSKDESSIHIVIYQQKNGFNSEKILYIMENVTGIIYCNSFD